MTLSELAAGVPSARVQAGGDTEICRVVQDSHEAGPGDLFVALRGLHVDSHDFAHAVARQGAAVALERDIALPPGTPALLLPDTRSGLGQLAAEVHGRPGRSLLMAAVTGTSGKTTVTHATAHILNEAGIPAGFLSTVAMDTGAGQVENLTGKTTIEAPALQENLARMVAAGKRAAVVETTSHALLQARVSGCEFDVCAVTNVGHDHLDYHPGWTAYLEAKAQVIDLCRQGWPKGIPKTAVLNRDDPSYEPLSRHRIEQRWTYSLEQEADLRAVDVRLSADSSRFRLVAGAEGADVELQFPARFNIANALAASGLCLALGVPVDVIAAGLSTFPGVAGRLEKVDLGQPFRIYVDFAHAAEALATTLSEVRAMTPGRVLAVFGATPRADHDSPGMGRAAAAWCDWFVITTDDPTDGDPEKVARDVEEGARWAGKRIGRDYEMEPDRRVAIRCAIAMARPGDAVVIAGKGHETWMLMEGRRKVPWDDRVEAAAGLRELGWSGHPSIDRGVEEAGGRA